MLCYYHAISYYANTNLKDWIMYKWWDLWRSIFLNNNNNKKKGRSQNAMGGMYLWEYYGWYKHVQKLVSVPFKKIKIKITCFILVYSGLLFWLKKNDLKPPHQRLQAARFSRLILFRIAYGLPALHGDTEHGAGAQHGASSAPGGNTDGTGCNRTKWSKASIHPAGRKNDD